MKKEDLRVPEEQTKLETAETIEALKEMEVYFAGCYMNAMQGGKAQEKFSRYLKAVSTAKKLLQRGDMD